MRMPPIPTVALNVRRLLVELLKGKTVTSSGLQAAATADNAGAT